MYVSITEDLTWVLIFFSAQDPATLGLDFSDGTDVANAVEDEDCEHMGIRHILTRIVASMVSCNHTVDFRGSLIMGVA